LSNKKDSIKFNLDNVDHVSVEKLDPPKDDIVNIIPPLTIVVLKNTQPIFVDHNMVGYVRDGFLIFEK
jgi:hypothetical protein